MVRRARSERHPCDLCRRESASGLSTAGPRTFAESEAGPDFRIATLDALVRMKLTSFRLKDKLHLMDLLDVGLIDQDWCNRLPVELGARLEELIREREREA